MSGDDSFIGRWSRRKREAGQDAPADQETRAGAPEETPGGDTVPAVSEEEALTLSDDELCDRLGLPDPATLKMGDDFRAFLAAGVPRRLRNLALRRLWRVNPALGALDDLIDYADDYTDAATALGAASTTYEVGQGLRAHVEKLREAVDKVVPAQNEAAAAPPASPAGPDVADATPPASVEEDDSAAAPEEPAEQSQSGEERVPGRSPAPRAPRHMVFRNPRNGGA